MREKASSKKKDVPADSPDKTAPDKRGTKEFPFVIDTEGHQDTATEAEKKAREKDDKHNVDDWTLRWAGITAGATVVLMIVGIGGVCYAGKTLDTIQQQIGEMKTAGKQTDRMLKHARKQAKAAHLGAQAIINSERAWVVVHPRQVELVPMTPGAIRPFYVFRHDLINKGKTVAKLIEFNAESRIVEHDAKLPSAPVYQSTDNIGIEFAHGTVLVPDDPISGVPVSLDESIVDWNTYQRVQAGDVALYVYGYIAYFDFSSGRRKVQFGYKYLPTGPENFDSKRIFWTQCGPLDYNTHT